MGMTNKITNKRIRSCQQAQGSSVFSVEAKMNQEAKLEALMEQAMKPRPFERMPMDSMYFDAVVLARRCFALTGGMTQISFCVCLDDLTLPMEVGFDDYVGWRVACLLHTCFHDGTAETRRLAREFIRSLTSLEQKRVHLELQAYEEATKEAM